MNLNHMLATQPISLALYHLPAIINSGSELTPVPDARDTYDTLIDANAIPWSQQWQQYLATTGGNRPQSASVPSVQPYQTVVPVSTPKPVKLSPARQTVYTWFAAQTAPFIQAKIRQATGLHRTTVNSIVQDAKAQGLLEVTGRLTQGSWHADQYRWIGGTSQI